MQQEKFKFPKTFHFPDSGSVGIDDKIFNDWKDKLCGKLVEISTKMDGENTTLCADGTVHARSLNLKKHWSREELTQLAEICLERNIIILNDEIHQDLVYSDAKHIPLSLAVPEADRILVTFVAPSKTFNLAGLQCSNIFIENPVLRQKFRRTIDRAGYSQPNALGLFAAQAAYENGLPWLNELRAYLEQNYARTKAFLAREMPRVRLIEPEGTYLLWLDFRAYGLSAHELDDIIVHKARLWLDSGQIFGADGDGFERLNIACPWQTLARGLTQLAAAFRDLPAAEQ